MHKLFSHAPNTETTTDPAPQTHTVHSLYTTLEMPLHELWAAFTEYAHLWWPKNLTHSPESYIEIGEQYLLEEEEDGTQHLIATTQHFIPEDIISLTIQENQLNSSFTTGLSFIFDPEDQGSRLEISSGHIQPRDINDNPEIGVLPQDITTARTLINSFARFMGSAIHED